MNGYNHLLQMKITRTLLKLIYSFGFRAHAILLFEIEVVNNIRQLVCNFWNVLLGRKCIILNQGDYCSFILLFNKVLENITY